jgi:hypothetical protein
MYIYLHFSTCCLIHFSGGAGRQMGVLSRELHHVLTYRRFLFSSKLPIFHTAVEHPGRPGSSESVTAVDFTNPRNFGRLDI